MTPANTLQAFYELDSLSPLQIAELEAALFRADDAELEQFLGSFVKSIGHAASSAAKTVGKAYNAVTKVIPSQILTSALSFTPIGMAVKAGLGAVSAAASGKNVFQGALRSLAPDVASKFLVDTAAGALRGENLLKTAKKAAQAGIGDVRESLRFATMVAPFVPGIGTGVAAALGAANALASGQPITEALIAAARNAVPGGAIAQVGFDMALNLAKGKNVLNAALDSARRQLPGGPAAQAAFDAGLALAKGKSLQDAAFAAAGSVLPKSPFASDALSFVRQVAAGKPLHQAALSAAGNLVMKRMDSAGRSAAQSLTSRAFPMREIGFQAEAAFNKPEPRRWAGNGNLRRTPAFSPENLPGWTGAQFGEAKRQLAVPVATGAVPVDCYVSSPEGASVLRQLLGTHGLLNTARTAGFRVRVTPA